MLAHSSRPAQAARCKRGTPGTRSPPNCAVGKRRRHLRHFYFYGANVRMMDGEGGEPLFVAADVCAALALGNTAIALRRLDDDEKGVGTADTLGGEQRLTTVNESGLYSLVLSSRKPEAKRFKKWVTGEVLPTIRKTGGYGTPTIDPMVALNDPATMRTLLLGYTEKVLADVREMQDDPGKAAADFSAVALAPGS